MKLFSELTNPRTFALLERALRVDTRSLRTHILRLLFVGGIFMVLISVQIDSRYLTNPGGRFFEGIAYANLLLLNLAAMSFFATLITEEKEEMTLGLMKMAGIGEFGILIGKLAPRLIAVLLLLSVQLPFTFLAVTLGGISMEQVLATYVSLMAFTVMVSGIGLLLSTFCARSSLATGLMTGLLMGCYLAPAIGYMMFGMRSGGGILGDMVRSICELMVEMSPFTAVNKIMRSNYAGGVFTRQVWLSVVIGLAAIVIARLIFDRCTRNEKPIAPSRGMAGFAIGLRRLGKKKNRSINSRVWQNAIAWKDFHFITGGMTALLIKFGAYALLIFIITVAGQYRTSAFTARAFGSVCFGSMIFALAIEIPIYISRVFREEIRWQTWPNLVLLPETVPSLAGKKLVGIIPTFLPAIGILFLGIMLNPRDFGDFLSAFQHVGAYYVVSQYLLLVHLSLYLSLVIKWGSLPLSVAIVFIFNVLMVMCLRGPSENVLVVPMFMSIVSCCILIGLILDKLRQAAAK